MQDFRTVMEPNTASRLRHTKKNVLKDYVAVAATMHVTHLVIFTQTKLGLYLKLCRLPHGPTLTFKINNFANCRDVLSTVKKQHTHPSLYLMGPCLMTNLQPEEGDLHLQLAAKMFLDMFPTITPHEAKTKSIQRSCLIHYDDEEGLFDFRHYAIRVVPVGLSKAVKKFNKRKLPDLSKFSDVSEFMTKSGMLSESEAEDDPSAQVTVPPNRKASKKLGPQKSSVRLSELGPRLTLKLLKIEEGLLEGNVLYSSLYAKSAEEKLALEKRRRVKKQLKARRKKEQEDNVEAKKMKKEDHKKKCLEGMSGEKEEKIVDDDAQYYREEVGEEPDIVFPYKIGQATHSAAPSHTARTRHAAMFTTVL
ncbi:Suppressor of SWI4 1 [Chionoecetes opilio]|uniref:Suppressor of SWI4 1 n=1 Tax=Chionoecetes opilio TaxID=41210 RepID=A0A8J4Y6K9_CHIOP|nr:Suppressor of SWI4 1 [Chionoecetes opilio]